MDDFEATTILFGFFMGCALVLGTTIYASVDSAKNQIPFSRDTYGPESPVAWAVACFMLWIVFFPYYLFRRSSVLNARRAPAREEPPSLERELRVAARLRDDGLITAAEYEQRKRSLLGPTS